MEKRKLTIKQAVELLGLSRATVYNWIDKNKLNFEETQRGKLIVISDDEIKQIREMNESYSVQESTDSYIDSSEQSNNTNSNVLDRTIKKSKTDNEHLIMSILERMNILDEKNSEYVNQIRVYAEQVGQVKLLTDNNKFYQDEYFRLKYNNESMSKELENLRQDKNDLLKENEQLKQENIKLDNIINDFMKADAARFEAKKDNFLSNIFSNKKNTPPNPLIIRK